MKKQSFIEFKIYYAKEFVFVTFAENVGQALENMQIELELEELPVIDYIMKSENGEAWVSVNYKKQAIANF